MRRSSIFINLEQAHYTGAVGFDFSEVRCSAAPTWSCHARLRSPMRLWLVARMQLGSIVTLASLGAAVFAPHKAASLAVLSRKQSRSEPSA